MSISPSQRWMISVRRGSANLLLDVQHFFLDDAVAAWSLSCQERLQDRRWSFQARRIRPSSFSRSRPVRRARRISKMAWACLSLKGRSARIRAVLGAAAESGLERMMCTTSSILIQRDAAGPPRYGPGPGPCPGRSWVRRVTTSSWWQDIVMQHFLQGKHLGLAVHQGQHDHAEGILQLGVLVKEIQHHAGVARPF